MTSPRHRQPSRSFFSGMADSELFDSSFFSDVAPLGARVSSSHTTYFTLPLDWSNHASSGLTIDGRAEAQGMANSIPTTTPLSQTQRDTVATGLNSIRSSLSFLVGLHPSEKQRLLKMGNKNRAFTEDAIQAGIANPGMLPRSIDPETLQGSLALYGQLREIQADLQQIMEMVDNTVTVLGSELYEDARLIYSLTKTKAQADGLNSAAARLSERFAGQGRRSADKTEKSEPVMQ